MEQTPMFTPKSPGPNGNPSGGQPVWLYDEALDKHTPETTIDHLLSEEDRQKWEQESREFEAVGRNLFLSEALLYPMFYKMVCERMASGVNPDVIREEMSTFHEHADRFGSIFLEAFEDALAGRPPRFPSTP
jgi:hypothetical protein